MTKQERTYATFAALGAGVLSLLWWVRRQQAIPVLHPSAVKWEKA